MTSPKAIVFGPTGGVGSAAALSAQKHGAKVFLAMRNTEKPIPGVSSQQEQSLGFERVQADLTQPDTISAAVTKTGAKHAFIYLNFGTTDGMKPIIQALKASGIEFVVFLSSYSVQGDDISKIPPEEIIPFAHASVELNLEAIFGPKGYMAIRPAFFASNAHWWAKMVPTGEVKLLQPEAKFDWIVPSDIGTVAGAFLAEGLSYQGNQKNYQYLLGAEHLSLQDAVKIAAKAVGKEVKVTAVDEEGGVKMFSESGTPEPVSKYLVKVMIRESQESKTTKQQKEELGATGAIEKFGGIPSTSFSDWVNQNKEIFT
ncbi:MAG: hypothetical protein Q9160_006156 [Pyrenula sp. 1 TL-2023]